MPSPLTRIASAATATARSARAPRRGTGWPSAKPSSCVTEVPSPGRGIGKAVDPESGLARCENHALLDWLAAPFLMA